MPKVMKLVITGGHFSPALSVIESLPKGTDVLLIGRKYTFEGGSNLSIEYQMAKKLSIPFRSITAGRLQRAFTRHSIMSFLKFPVGFFQSFAILKEYKPDVIMSFGGYISLPSVLAGALLNIPIVAHEQTLNLGLSNKIASFFAKKICMSWQDSKNDFPSSKTILTGLPIKKFSKVTESPLTTKISKEKIPLLYVTGGSSGSHTINVLIETIIKSLLKNFRVIHQTGDSDFGDFSRLEKTRESLDKTLQERYVLTKFVDSFEVGSILDLCDLVVSRSGMNAIAEFISFGKPALLIPLNKEQMQNALFLKRAGLAEVESQDKLTPQKLFYRIIAMMGNIQSYKSNIDSAKKLLVPNASENIIRVVEGVALKK